jgi:tyrosinase
MTTGIGSASFTSSAPSPTAPVADPTWYGDIRYMFTDSDDAHMGNQGLDLTSYDAVVASASGIYGQVSAGNMPPGSPWPAAWTQTFLNWMIANYPKGTDTSSGGKSGAAALARVQGATATRIRKDINALQPPELATLKQAFSAIMAKDPGDPNSYFVQAGLHWLPAHPGLYCQHHVPSYNPWHRAFMLGFENALRSVPGCEQVTLPYWDITTPFPAILKSAPFDAYTLPQDVGLGYNAGYVTQRYSYPDIAANLAQFDVTGDINRALTKNNWEDFHGLIDGRSNNTIISAHDSGHGSIGPTMADQNVAAFDPVFWFFHANWDRLFWQWQTEMNATILRGLMTTIESSASKAIFSVPVLESMVPFKLKTVDIVDSVSNLDVDYQPPQAGAVAMKVAKLQEAALAAKPFRVKTDMVNVRVRGINRLKIPGGFSVHLLKDDKPIASRFFFQPTEVEKCESCVNNATVHFDFELPLDAVKDGQLSVRVEPVDKSFVGNNFPSKMMGNPTVDVHLLLHHE